MLLSRRFIPILNKVSIRTVRQSIPTLSKSDKEYTETNEWLCHNKDKEYTKIGLSQYAIDELSELVYIEYLYQGFALEFIRG